MSFTSGDAPPDPEETAKLLRELRNSYFAAGVILAVNAVLSVVMVVLIVFVTLHREAREGWPNFAIALSLTAATAFGVAAAGAFRRQSWTLYFGLGVTYIVTLIAFGGCNIMPLIFSIAAAYFLHRTLHLAKLAEQSNLLP